MLDGEAPADSVLLRKQLSGREAQQVSRKHPWYLQPTAMTFSFISRNVAFDEFLSRCRIRAIAKKIRGDRGLSRRTRSRKLPSCVSAWNPFKGRYGGSPPIAGRATATRALIVARHRLDFPSASGPSLFVQPGIDLRHQDRTKGKFPGLRLSRQSAEVAAGRSDRRAPL
jgi:hypothetical protein